MHKPPTRKTASLTVSEPTDLIDPAFPLPSLTEGITHGAIEVRIARSPEEIDAAQRLRFKVFFEEMNARPSPEVLAAKRDFDRFDAYCDHLIVLDHGRRMSGETDQADIVATYRLLRRSVAEKHGGFYTATEFDVTPLFSVGGEIMEVGRACVSPTYRNRASMQLLWRGIATYAVQYDVKIMFGCGSLPGTDPQALARTLSYLHYNHLAPEAIRARALPHLYERIDLLPPRDIDVEAAVEELEARSILSTLPPLIKGYLRLGGFIGDGAVIDHEFGTTDVCIIVVTDKMAAKYFKHYLATAEPAL